MEETKMKKLLLMLVMGVVMLGCGKKLNLSDVAGKEFILKSPLGEYSITLKVEADGRVNGFSGVNRYMGAVEIKDGKVKFNDGMAGTMMAGPDEKMKAEAEYTKTLLEAESATYKDGKLAFKIKGGKTLEFEEVKE